MLTELGEGRCQPARDRRATAQSLNRLKVTAERKPHVVEEEITQRFLWLLAWLSHRVSSGPRAGTAA